MDAETTRENAAIGYTWGNSEGMYYLMNGDREFRKVSENVIRMLDDVADGEVTRSELPADAASVLERLESLGYVRSDGSVERIDRPDDVRFWPRAALFCLLFGAAVVVVLRESAPLFGGLIVLGARDVVTVIALTLVSLAVHEGGHWAAARPFFSPSFDVSTINGVIPALVTTTDEAWILPRNRRRWISLAGPFAETVWVLCVATVSYAAGGPGVGVRLFVTLAVLRIAASIFPLVRGDGYWLLVDTIGAVNLQQRGVAHVRARTLSWPACYVILSYAFVAAVTVGALAMMLSWGLVGLAAVGVWVAVLGYSSRERLASLAERTGG